MLYDVIYVAEYDYGARSTRLVFRKEIEIEKAISFGNGMAGVMGLKPGMATNGEIRAPLLDRIQAHGIEDGFTYNWLSVAPNDFEENIIVKPSEDKAELSAETTVKSAPWDNAKRRLIDSGVPADRIEMAEKFFTISAELKMLGILGQPTEDQYALFILGDIVSFGVLYNEASRLRMSALTLTGKTIEVEDAASAAERICVDDATVIWDAIKNQKPLPAILYTKSGNWLVNQMRNRA